MDDVKDSFPDSINPNNFPAKLWRLVNDPANKAISWDSLGQAIVINQHLFMTQILSPGSSTLDNPETFKMTHFSSFIRQLNLYGFNKVPPAAKSDSVDGYHCFHNTNFKRNQPHLVASLKRLTAHNKAKIEAGLDVTDRPPRRYLRYSGGEGGGDIKVEAGRSSLPSPRHEKLTHPYCSSQAHAMAAHTGTPLPPRFLTRGYGTALTPAVFATDKGMPGSSSHQYAGVASSSSATHIQQGLLAPASLGNPNMSYAQYQPGFYSSYCHPNLVAAHMAGSGLQAGLFSPCTYHQTGYLMNTPCYIDHGSNNKEHQEKKYDINLDNVFQMADEVMQPPTPSSRLVQVVTPEKPSPVLLLPFSSNIGLRDSPAKAKPLLYPIMASVTGNAELVAFKQLEESMVSPPHHLLTTSPEKLPEDAIIKVSTDDTKNIEVKDVEAGD